ncbi:hypothetical protein GE300_07245 [Rhodobacteraceae bacterium 2CG4]|uniref:Uncharacterized protein n=1 Tax=Halovulum marinum TaxID=2662447 RepID=A0A6L5YZC6_9RHOB|nr:hypothetical protein [Halovulum marinum]MSU89409.1 hypothetical protein [Halovulum marinum]
MTIITAMFLIVGVGAVIQRGEDGESLIGGGSFEPRADSFTLRAGRVQTLDVLLNDANADRADVSAMQILRAPECGVASVVDGAVQYSSPADCAGTIEISYCLPYDGKCKAVPVTLKVLSSLQVASVDTALPQGPGAPVVAAPDQDRVALRQPMRLTLPDAAEVITPSEATAEVRRMREAAPAVAQAADAGHDANVTVSRTSARSGAVSVAGAEMAAPAPATETAGIAVAGPGDRDPRRAPAPMGLAVASAAPRTAPAFRPPAFRPPAPPVAATPQVMASVPALPTMPLPETAAAPAAAGSLRAAEPGIIPPVTASAVAPAAAPAAAQVAAPTPAPQTGPAVATEIAALNVPATEDALPVPASPTGPAAATGVAALDMPASADVQSAPAVQADVARVAAGGATAPSQPALQQLAAVPAPQTPLPAADVARAPTAAPAAPAAAEVALAPDAQITQPAQAPAPQPEERSLIASLARSNTVLGATVSAAKALFGPGEPAPAAAVVESAPAPRPKGPVEVATLDLDAGGIEEAAGTLTAGTADIRPDTAGKPVEMASLDPQQDRRPYKRRTEEALTPLQLLLGGEETATAPAAAPGPEVAALSGAGTGPALPEAGTGPAAAGLPAPAPATAETEVAALPPAAADPVLEMPRATPALGAAPRCDIDLSMQVQVGAELVASLSSPCRPEQTFLVEHAGLVFSAETDADGVANFIVPAMQSNAIVRVTFPDGGSAVDRATVEGMSRMTRIAVIWTDELDFDLHAREFGARPGSDGDIWEGNARDYRTARRSGGGYVTLLGPFKGPGARAEVYTIFETLRTDPGDIEFALEMNAYSDACARQPVVRVLRSEQAHLVDTADLALDTGICSGGRVAGADFGLARVRIVDAY